MSDVQTTMRAEITDSRGGTTKLEMDADGGVLIRLGSVRAATIAVTDLREAVDTLAPLTLADLVQRLADGLMAAGDTITVTKAEDGTITVQSTTRTPSY